MKRSSYNFFSLYNIITGPSLTASRFQFVSKCRWVKTHGSFTVLCFQTDRRVYATATKWINQVEPVDSESVNKLFLHIISFFFEAARDNQTENWKKEQKNCRIVFTVQYLMNSRFQTGERKKPFFLRCKFLVNPFVCCDPFVWLWKKKCIHQRRFQSDLRKRKITKPHNNCCGFIRKCPKHFVRYEKINQNRKL